MTFRVRGISAAPFIPLYGLTDAQLAARGARRYVVDEVPGFPDRIELRDVALGQAVLLVNYTHLPSDTPFRASHAIFVRKGAKDAYDRVGEIPVVLRTRVLSLRAYGEDHYMIDADLCAGAEVELLIERLLSDRRVAYLHVHYAKRGCYAAHISRA